jgi:hypothetical protein
MILQPIAARGGSSARVSAICTAAETVGDMVYTSGPRIGAKYQVRKISVSTIGKRIIFGMIISKSSDTECVVQWSGVVSGLYTGLVTGLQLYVDLSSRLSTTPPELPTSGTRLFQVAAVSVSDDIVMLSTRTSVLMQAA